MKKPGAKKKIIRSLVENLIILIGLLVLLYPYISDWWNQMHESRVIATYAAHVHDNSDEENEALYQEAIIYNETIADQYSAGATLTEEEQESYNDVLDASDMGIMGYIEIAKIDCRLPIYHDTDESVLQIAIGHLPWSSLPVGNEGAHAVLSGHRGLPSAKLFTRLDEMEIGDRFSVYVANHQLTYEVDQIRTILPEDTTYLEKEEGRTLCTLFTCTPYGINTHRLLVRGTLISDEAVSTEELAEATAEDTTNHWMKLGLFAAAVLVLLILLMLLRKKLRNRKPKKEMKIDTTEVLAEEHLQDAETGNAADEGNVADEGNTEEGERHEQESQDEK